MSHFIRWTLVVLPIGLLVAGCSSSRNDDYRAESSYTTESSTSTRIIGEPVASDEMDTDRSTSDDDLRAEFRSEQSASRFDVTLDEIRGHVRDNSAVIVDARSAEDFAKGHVRGAINIPANQKESALRRARSNLSTDQLIIIYCGSPQCPAGESVYEYLLSQGYTNMRVYKPGWKTLSGEKDLLD